MHPPRLLHHQHRLQQNRNRPSRPLESRLAKPLRETRARAGGRSRRSGPESRRCTRVRIPRRRRRGNRYRSGWTTRRPAHTKSHEGASGGETGAREGKEADLFHEPALAFGERDVPSRLVLDKLDVDLSPPDALRVPLVREPRLPRCRSRRR